MMTFRQPIQPGSRVFWDERAMAILLFAPDGSAVRRNDSDNKYLAEFLLNERDFRQFVMLLADMHNLNPNPSKDRRSYEFSVIE